MSIDDAVSEHYLHGELLEAIQTAISRLGKTVNSVTIEDLAPVEVTARIIEQLHVLRHRKESLIPGSVTCSY